jgi:hypothetical protein
MPYIKGDELREELDPTFGVRGFIPWSRSRAASMSTSTAKGKRHWTRREGLPISIDRPCG